MTPAYFKSVSLTSAKPSEMIRDNYSEERKERTEDKSRVAGNSIRTALSVAHGRRDGQQPFTANVHPNNAFVPPYKPGQIVEENSGGAALPYL